MKRTVIKIFFLCLISVSYLAAQDTEPSLWFSETTHYVVTSSISEVQAIQTGKEMESLYSLYNNVFNYNDSDLESKLNVRIFATKADYDSYLNLNIGQSREDFVYLHYSRPSQSELVGFVDKSINYNRSLAHQGFIQFIKAYIENPPLWIREGFAVYFENITWDAENETVIFEDNYSWLPTLKELISESKLSSISLMLTKTEESARENIEVFYPEAWSFVQFLNESSDYTRIINNSINQIDSELSLEENSSSILMNIIAWTSEEELTTSYLDFYSSKKTFRETVLEGIDYYQNQLMESADTTFREAVELQPNNYIPYYYLGLIYYADSDYQNAQTYYDLAREKDAPVALVDYATGINAFASDNSETALAFLNSAAESDPEMFSSLVSEILPRLN